MPLFKACKFRPGVLLIVLALSVISCRTPRYETFYGKTNPPPGQVMRYVTGSEPGSLNPQKVSSQSTASMCVALFEGLCEFDPKTLDPIPAIAERWEVNKDSSEYVFYLRKNARWSNGEQITAQDFLYSFRRGVSPKTASPSADIGYRIKYAQDFNERKVFIRHPDNNTYLLEKDFAPEPEKDAPVPEATTTYYAFNVTKPPTNDVLVRRAFNMAIDKVTRRKAGQPLAGLIPEALFPGYPLPKGEPFDPIKAKQLLAQAGYRGAAGNYDPQKFPVDKVEISYNRSEMYQEVSEFLQAQWMQNLGLTVPLEKMEFKTLLYKRDHLDYQGIVRGDWVADYIDPYNFLNVFRWPRGSGTGWDDKEFVKLLDAANRAPDQQRRYEILAKAEARLLAAQPIIPLMTNSTNWMKKPYVKGMYPNLGTMHAWKFVCIEHDSGKWDYGIPSLSYESQSQDFNEREKELPVCTK